MIINPKAQTRYPQKLILATDMNRKLEYKTKHLIAENEHFHPQMTRFTCIEVKF